MHPVVTHTRTFLETITKINTAGCLHYSLMDSSDLHIGLKPCLSYTPPQLLPQHITSPLFTISEEICRLLQETKTTPRSYKNKYTDLHL